MGRKCAVPHCYTGYRKCKEKASLYKVPDDDFFLNKWQEAIAREDRPITPRDYVCEKHFKEDDIQRSRVIKNVVEVYLRPKLRPDAVPSIFPDLPEFILKMVKKRRKLLPQDILKLNGGKSSNGEGTEETDKLKEHHEEMEVKEEEEKETGNTVISNDISNNEIEIKSENEDLGEKEIEEDTNKPKTYKCEECEYETKYPHNLRTHKTKHLTGEKAYIYCEKCPNFKTKWELTYRNHMKIKHGVGSQEIFYCSLCEYNTRVKICLKRHLERHNREVQYVEKFKCQFPDCNYECDSKALFKIHMLVHKEENEHKAFKCTECHYGTNSKTHILKHIKSAHNTGDDTVVSIGTKKSQEPSQKKRRSNGKPIYRCVKCEFQTPYHALLLKHLVKHKEGEDNVMNISKVWKCSKCPYATFFQHALEVHKKTDCEKTTPAAAVGQFNETDHKKYNDDEENLNDSNTEKNDILNEMSDHENAEASNVSNTIEDDDTETNHSSTEEYFKGFQTVVVKEEHEAL